MGGYPEGGLKQLAAVLTKANKATDLPWPALEGAHLEEEGDSKLWGENNNEEEQKNERSCLRKTEKGWNQETVAYR